MELLKQESSDSYRRDKSKIESYLSLAALQQDINKYLTSMGSKQSVTTFSGATIACFGNKFTYQQTLEMLSNILRISFDQHPENISPEQHDLISRLVFILATMERFLPSEDLDRTGLDRQLDLWLSELQRDKDVDYLVVLYELYDICGKQDAIAKLFQADQKLFSRFQQRPDKLAWLAVKLAEQNLSFLRYLLYILSETNTVAFAYCFLLRLHFSKKLPLNYKVQFYSLLKKYALENRRVFLAFDLRELSPIIKSSMLLSKVKDQLEENQQNSWLFYLRILAECVFQELAKNPDSAELLELI